MPRQPVGRWSHAQETKNQLRLLERLKIPAEQALHLWWAPQTMSATCFDKAFGGSVANHHSPRPTSQQAKDCSQNPVLGIAACRYLADREPAHPPAGQNSSNRDAENSWPRDYIKKRMNTTVDQRSP